MAAPTPRWRSSLFDPYTAATVGVAGCVVAGVTLVAGPAAAPVAAGLACVAAMIVVLRMTRRRAEAETRRKLFHVADELVQYRAFTRLMRAQGDRIVAMSDDAALTIASGLRQMDEAITALAGRLAATGPDEAPQDTRDALADEAAAIALPMMTMLAKLQFQDVTRQQIDFLSRLSILLDDHMAALARQLGDRRSLDRTTRFKELFDLALNETVMTSQRDDHRAASGLDFLEQSGPAVELFVEEEGTR